MRKTSPLHAIYTFLVFYTKPMLKKLHQGFKSCLFTLGNATATVAWTASVQFLALLVVFINICHILFHDQPLSELSTRPLPPSVHRLDSAHLMSRHYIFVYLSVCFSLFTVWPWAMYIQNKPSTKK